jgi:hypothetical protein
MKARSEGFEAKDAPSNRSGPDITKQPFVAKYEKNSINYERLNPTLILFVAVTPTLENTAKLREKISTQ